MTLEFSLDHNHNFALKRVFDQPVLSRNSLTLCAFHELGAQNHDVATILNKDAVTKHKVFVPQEKVVFVAMLDGTDRALVRALNTFDHLVNTKCVSLGVSATKSTAT